MTPSTESSGASEAPKNKPRLALALATALGVGYIPKAPGTFGSLVGIVVAILTHPVSLLALFVLLVHGPSLFMGLGVDIPEFLGRPAPVLILAPSLVALLVVGLVGVWSASRVAAYSGRSDPQYVVIDEVSGMHLTLLLGLVPLGIPTHVVPADQATVFALYSGLSLLNWKYLLLGFVLFRGFDIWKPFPIRRLEKLRGGWGIMADDWMAGIYAAILLRVALHFNLLQFSRV